jgi:hypothetical protein
VPRARYNKQWLAKFSLASVVEKEEVHRIVLAHRASERAKRRLEEDSKLPLVAAVEEAVQEEATDALTATIRSRAESLYVTLGEDEDADEESARASAPDGPSARDSDSGASSSRFGWQPAAYLLKRSPAGLGFRWTWQRRWFEVTEADFAWYQSREAAEKGAAPLGRVPRSMLLTARAVPKKRDCFEIDVGNRLIQLALHRVEKAHQEVHVGAWVEALIKQQVLGEVPEEACSHKAKFWKGSKRDVSVADQLRRPSLVKLLRRSSNKAAAVELNLGSPQR